MPGLCFRCEHRAHFVECYHDDKEYSAAPRYECSQTSFSAHSCYMYTPVIPIIIKRNEGDRRPIAGSWMISARCHGERVAIPTKDVELHGKSLGKNLALTYWVAKEKDNAKSVEKRKKIVSRNSKNRKPTPHKMSVKKGA